MHGLIEQGTQASGHCWWWAAWLGNLHASGWGWRGGVLAAGRLWLACCARQLASLTAIGGLAACLVQEEIQLTKELAGPLLELQQAARHIAEVSRESKLEVDVDEYVGSFTPYLMDIIYKWSQGATFAEITLNTDIFEGSIIRATRRLDELMQQLEQAAKVVGDTELAARFAESRATIRRDIMFAASLYV